MANSSLTRLPLAALGLSALLAVLLACSPATAAGRCDGPRAISRCATAAFSSPSGEEEEEEEDEAEGEEVEAEEDEDEGLGLSEGDEQEAEGEKGEAVAKGTLSVSLSDLRLTAKTAAALKHHSPAVSSVGFSFVLSAPTEVHVTLFKQTTSHGHSHWSPVPGSVTVSAVKGQIHHSLGGRGRLSSGRYMLTATPGKGRSRSIYLSTHG